MVTKVEGQNYSFGFLGRKSTDTAREMRVEEAGMREMVAFNHKVDVQDLGKEGARVTVHSEGLYDGVPSYNVLVGGNIAGLQISRDKTSVEVPMNGRVYMHRKDNPSEVLLVKHSEFGNF